MLCGGEYDLKARVLYDVLQDNMQDKISAGDRDIHTYFINMVILSSYMMLRIFREESGKPYVTQHYPEPGSQEFLELIDDMKEQFLDTIFDD